MEVRVQPDSKVVFWAAEPGDGGLSWEQAYRGYQNSGVTTSDSSGMATLKVREPQGYSVPFRGYLEPHIHFRVCGVNGFIGRIKTVYLADGRVEGFMS
jgi:protocatechuate 3,4-dioxygenase beta subunit